MRRVPPQRRDSRPRRWLCDLWPDLRQVARQLRRAPGAAAFVIATLAIGIGANVTMIGVIDRLLLRAPEGVNEPDRLARLVFVTPGTPLVGTFTSYPALLDLRREVSAFEDLAAFTRARLPLGTGPDALDVSATLVTASFFHTLGVRPALGRFFSPSDGYPDGTTPGGPALTVLAHGFWQRALGGDSAVLGRALRIGKLTYTVVGVAPPRFKGLDVEPPDLWLPLTVTADQEVRRFALEDWGMSWLSPVARLRAGVARDVAEEEVSEIVRRSARLLGERDESRTVLASVIRGRGPDAPREVKVALWLGGIATLVLLIACANVANLLLARTFTRRREIAIRLAMGAGRGRLARQMLADAVLIALLGGGLALGIAGAGGGVLRRFFLSTDDATLPFVDVRLFAATAVIALGTGVIMCLAPLTQSLTPDLTRALRVGATSGGGRTSRTRVWLLGTQAALCMLLLVVAGLFTQSLRRIEGLDLGMNPERTLMVSFNLDYVAMTSAEREAMYAEMAASVRAIPGVVRVALGNGGGRAVNVHTKTRDTGETVRRTQDVPYEAVVDSGYFRVLGTSLRGRDFTATDAFGAPRVTIINEPLARLLFPGDDALGQCIYLPMRSSDPDDDCWTVVGVLRGFWYSRSILKREGLLVYVPLAQRRSASGRPRQMVIAVSGDPTAIMTAVRQAFRRVHPELARVNVRWMRDVLEPELRPWRLGATMFSVFGAVALVIATVGLYGVAAFTAAQRSSEIAVRIALGARARDVLSVVAGDGLRAVLAGLAVGVLTALSIRRWVGPLLFQTSASDPGVIVGMAALLITVALAASLVPTTRSLRRSPAVVLRED